jgi:uncharacterized protein YjiS (DUF1127 family)
MFDSLKTQNELMRVQRMADQLTDRRSVTALTAYANDLHRDLALSRAQTFDVGIVI